MLIQFDNMIGDRRIFEEDSILKCVNGEVCLRVEGMIEYLSKHKKDFGLNYPLLEKKDFITQAEKGGYIINRNKSIRFNGAVKKAVVFNLEKLKQLDCNNMIIEQFNKM